VKRWSWSPATCNQGRLSPSWSKQRMQKLAEVCIRQPVFAAMLVLALVVIGIASYFRLGVDRYPSVDLPTVRVLTRLPGASPEEVESQISQRLEDAINTIEGVNQLWSISGPGSSIIIITFNLEREINTATQDVRDRIATTLRDLPQGADPPLISKVDNDAEPVLTLALSSARSSRELTELADNSSAPQVSAR
jgi:hydrophobic/amphiphilic exporter-1 (mainly G- bacteria), HAE1 family